MLLPSRWLLIDFSECINQYKLFNKIVYITGKTLLLIGEDRMKEEQKQMDLVNRIKSQCLSREITVTDAVDKIDEAIGGISQVFYREGLNFKIVNCTEIYDLFERKGLSKAETNIMYGLAVVSYFKAKRNHLNQKPGEVHISRKASTNDHMSGIYRILEKYVA